MGFLDDAKSKLKNMASGMGEETFDINDNPQKNEKPKKPAAVPGFGKVKMKKDIGKDKPIKMDYQESDFDGDDAGADYFDQMESEHKEFMDGFDEKHNIGVKEGRIQDVLFLLNIPETFELRDFVLLPEDLDGIDFDIQVPKGYELGQVDNFVAQVKKTLKELVSLLKLRNKHVAELATTVDRLQVDANNLKVDAQLANTNIAVMPTDDSEELQAENLDLRMYIKSLEAEKDNLLRATNGEYNDMSINEEERETLNQLKNEFSILQREKNSLVEENRSLRSQVASLIEESDALEDNSLNRALYADSSQDQAHSANFEEFGNWDDADDFEIPLESPSTPRRFPHSIEEVTVPDDDDDDPMYDPSYEEPFGVQNFSGEMNQSAFELDLSEFNGDFSNTDFTEKIKGKNKRIQDDEEMFAEPEQSLDDFMVENQQYYTGENQGGTIDNGIEYLDDDGNFSN